MILQALTQYYETLVQAGVLAGPGWGPVKASYALSIAGQTHSRDRRQFSVR